MPRVAVAPGSETPCRSRYCHDDDDDDDDADDGYDDDDDDDDGNDDGYDDDDDAGCPGGSSS